MLLTRLMLLSYSHLKLEQRLLHDSNVENFEHELLHRHGKLAVRVGAQFLVRIRLITVVHFYRRVAAGHLKYRRKLIENERTSVMILVQHVFRIFSYFIHQGNILPSRLYKING